MQIQFVTPTIQRTSYWFPGPLAPCHSTYILVQGTYFNVRFLWISVITFRSSETLFYYRTRIFQNEMKLFYFDTRSKFASYKYGSFSRSFTQVQVYRIIA